jgi:serine/threonine-protein kinase RsbW
VASRTHTITKLMNKLSRHIPSKLENVAPFIREVLELLESGQLSEEEAFPVKLSLEEALTNAIRHGNKLNPDLFVDVDLDLSPEKVVVSVKDEGSGFDVAQIVDPTAGANVQKPGGRGVFLIKELMDEVSYFDGGRGVKMVRFFGKRA